MRKIRIAALLLSVLVVLLAMGAGTAAAAGDVLKITVPITAGEGEQKTAFLALHSAADWTEIDELGVRFPFAAGDKLVYEVAISEAVPGVGGFDAQEGVGWAMMSASLDAGATDQNGVSALPNCDLSAVAVNQWYLREITPPAGFLDMRVTGWYLMINTTAAVPNNTIDVYLRSMKVVHSDSTETIIFDADNTVKYRAYWVLLQGAAGVGDLTTSLVADPFAAEATPTQGESPNTSDSFLLVLPMLTLALGGGMTLALRRKK